MYDVCVWASYSCCEARAQTLDSGLSFYLYVDSGLNSGHQTVHHLVVIYFVTLLRRKIFFSNLRGNLHSIMYFSDPLV